MSIRKQMQKEYEKDMNNIFLDDLRLLFASLYKRHMSEAIKRGIRAKKVRNQL